VVVDAGGAPVVVVDVPEDPTGAGLSPPTLTGASKVVVVVDVDVDVDVVVFFGFGVNVVVGELDAVALFLCFFGGAVDFVLVN
jgi:hypothetical protein